MENWGKSFRFSTTSFTTGDLAVDVAPSQTLHPYNHQIISRLAGGIIWHFHPNIRKPLAFQNTNRKHLQNAQPQKELLRRAGDWGLPQQATSDRLDSQMHCLRRMANQKCKFIFQEDAITLFLNTTRKQCICIHKCKNACWGRAPILVNCDGTSQAVHYGTQTFSSSKNSFYGFL